MKLFRSARFFQSAAGITAVAAVGTLTLGGTWALFSATESNASDSFTAGTVEVGTVSGSTTCNVSVLMPGDSSTAFGSGSASLTPCSYKVKYTGTATAWLAVDITVGSGSPSLFTGASTGLQLLIKNGSTTLMNGTTYKTISGTDTTVATNTAVQNILLSATPAATNDQAQFDVNYLLPLLAPNALQGGSATVTLTFHAVQSANQPIGSCVAGRQCNTIVWS